MQEVLLGFDIREIWLDISSFWNIERRNTYLLQQQVQKPLSVDPTVWPSAYDLDVEIQLVT